MPEGKGKPPKRSTIYAVVMIGGAILALAVIAAGVASGEPAANWISHFAGLFGR